MNKCCCGKYSLPDGIPFEKNGYVHEPVDLEAGNFCGPRKNHDIRDLKKKVDELTSENKSLKEENERLKAEIQARQEPEKTDECKLCHFFGEYKWKFCPRCGKNLGERKMSLDFRLQIEIELFWKNITHNLGKMADEAGIYKALWRPNENGYVYANDIIDILEKGLEDLKKRPKHFEKFNSPNGWGLYEHFVPFVQECYDACVKHPKAKIYVSV
ncbi:MAG: hypothetical protein GF334_05045 [Candidatus Altiarchaeales archaeon]|nr:hypothetical protein [Candidatus Altiarchaeales archaeon]